jgi:phosphatidylglycerol---prolipoprotein diacylglyceryl transferase
MLPILQIGPAALPVPALLLLAGFWIGLDLTEKHAPRFGASAAQIYHMVLVALLVGLVGARISYAMQSPAAFAASPLSLFSIRPQMLDLPGGLLFAALGALVYGQRRKMALWPTLDALTSLFAVMLVCIGLANFASGDGFGAPTGLPWAIQLWGTQRHPSQVYETLAALLVAVATWPGSAISRRSEAGMQSGATAPAGAQPGLRFWAFLALTGLSQVVLQGFRGDSVVLAGLRAAQLLSWLVLAVSLWQIGRRLIGWRIRRSADGPGID